MLEMLVKNEMLEMLVKNKLVDRYVRNVRNLLEFF
jgi:hypothetical protein